MVVAKPNGSKTPGMTHFLITVGLSMGILSGELTRKHHYQGNMLIENAVEKFLPEESVSEVKRGKRERNAGNCKCDQHCECLL